jgi:hypothetical protein
MIPGKDAAIGEEFTGIHGYVGSGEKPLERVHGQSLFSV